MVTVHFTSHLERFTECGAVSVEAETVGEALHAAIADKPLLKSYVMDEQNRLRRHVMVFVGGSVIKDRTGLTDRVTQADEVYVMQALSGG